MVKEIGNELERNAEVCNLAALEVNPCYPIIALQLPVFILAWPPAPLTWVDVLFIQIYSQKGNHACNLAALEVCFVPGYRTIHAFLY